MRLVYILLSPTFGMHQYTADLANRMARLGHDVHLVTTARYPRDRYLPAVQVHTPVDTRNTGFSPDALRPRACGRALEAIRRLAPDVAHFGGPHLWNVLLLRALARAGIPTLHTLHDLAPHSGTPYGRLLLAWNRLVARWAGHLLVHGAGCWEQLVAQGVSPSRVTSTPLLHLFLGQGWLEAAGDLDQEVRYEPWALFFGRLERYKGVDSLMTAAAMLDGRLSATSVVVAGPGPLDALWGGALPEHVEVRNRLIGDEEALDLFRRCGLVVLPYHDATQSALIAAAYFFRKPVVVTRTGALPEYVQDEVTGCVVEPRHPASLARCLERMLNDPARLERQGAAGRAWYERQRAQEQADLLRLYQKLGRRKLEDGKQAQVGGYS